MAGYSGTPLPLKLGIKPESAVLLIDEPADFEAALAPLPAGATLCREAASKAVYDVIVFFTKSEKVLRSRFAKLARVLQPAGGLWIGWPKKSSGVATDLTEDVIRGIGLKAGLVDNKVCAIDETWSGLRFVVRLADRKPK